MSREELLQELKNGIIEDAVKEGVNEDTIKFAKKFGVYLATTTNCQIIRNGCEAKLTIKKLTTNQVRKFFGEVKHQQMAGYNLNSFVLLKPKLAYAVGRSEKKEDKKNKEYIENKIIDFYNVMSTAIDAVISEGKKGNEEAFKNFIAIFESIVAYHKLAENS